MTRKEPTSLVVKVLPRLWQDIGLQTILKYYRIFSTGSYFVLDNIVDENNNTDNRFFVKAEVLSVLT